MRSLQQAAQTDFVFLESPWTAAYALKVLRAAKGRGVIIHRQHGGQVYFYLYPRREVQAALKSAPGEMPVANVLDLHEWKAAETRPPGQPAEGVQAAVVLDDGRPVGYLLPGVGQARKGALQRIDLEEALDRNLGGGPHAAPPPPPPGEPEPQVLERTLQADFCASLPVGREAELKVFLVAGKAAELPGLGMAQPAGTELDVIIQARRGLEVSGDARGKLVIGSQDEFEPLRFTLKAVEEGQGDVRVIVSIKGMVFGYLKLTPVVEPAASAGDPRPVTVNAGVAAMEVSTPDLTLHIELEERGGQRGFVIYLTAQNPELDLNYKKIGPVFFQTDPGPYFERFYRDIEGLPIGSPQDQARAAKELEARGLFLFEMLPPAAQEELWRLKDRIKTVFIQSGEPWVPWEICRLEGVEKGKKVEGPFFCEAFEMTRWLPGGKSPRPQLHLNNLAVVAPEESNLPYSMSELKYLLELASGGRKVTRIPARYLDLLSAFSAGDRDGWHFSGHGAVRGSDPNHAEMILDQKETLSPLRISGSAANLGQARPLVFLNACQIGAGGMALTDIGGWARQFLEAGAGAFIGANWAVYDRTAYLFAKDLYTRLLGGKPVGQAVREARLAVKPAGDSTWLAYTVFAHPLAVVRG